MIDPAQLPPRHPADDPRGVLTFRAPLPDDLQRAEDATAAADVDRARAVGPRFRRPATPTEVGLLAAVGFVDGGGEPPDVDLMTEVDVRGSIRRREWPDLHHPDEQPTQNTQNGSTP